VTVNEADINSACRNLEACPKCGGGDYPYCRWVFSSKHPGGANFVMGDASVKFISQNINLDTWRNLNYIHDGNFIGDF